VTEVDVGNSAVLDHVKVQAEGPGAFHLAVTRARVADDGAYNGFALALGARLSRAEAWVDLNGCHGSCRLAGAYLLRDRQHCDNTTVIEHRVPHTTCREVFRGVLDDGARAVFQGRIVVKREAQHADGQQSSKALLLSDQSEVDQKPELEIYADAVKCSHGATAGQIDGNALFYLRSRGIPEVEARRLLIESFLEDALEQIGPEDLRAAMRSEIAGWFAAEKGGAL
jgi:Fe-S cluster assembly protein SufD